MALKFSLDLEGATFDELLALIVGLFLSKQKKGLGNKNNNNRNKNYRKNNNNRNNNTAANKA